MSKILIALLIVLVLTAVGVGLYFLLRPAANANGGNQANSCNVWTPWPGAGKETAFPSWAVTDATGTYAPGAQKFGDVYKVGYASLASGSQGFYFWDGHTTEQHALNNTQLIKRDPTCPKGLQFARPKTTDKVFAFGGTGGGGGHDVCMVMDRSRANGVALKATEKGNKCGLWGTGPNMSLFYYVRDDTVPAA